MKRTCVISLLFVFAVFLYSEDSGWKRQIKEHVAQNVLFAVSSGTEIAKNEQLLAVYYYDQNKTMYKTDFLGNPFKLPHTVLHTHFVKLLQVGKKNVYVSSLFSINQKDGLYFIAKHLSDGYVMFLFSLPSSLFPSKKYIIFNEKTDILFSAGFSSLEEKNIENVLKDNLNHLDTLEDKFHFDKFSILESNSLMYFYVK